MKLEYSPSRDKFYNDCGEVPIESAKIIFERFDDMITMNGGMGRVIQFNWDMRKVHDYYGNGD